jgi:hypothetical protein
MEKKMGLMGSIFGKEENSQENILNIRGASVEFSCGRIESQEDFEALLESMEEGSLNPDDLPGSYDSIHDYQDVLSSWGIWSDDINNISISVIDQNGNETEISNDKVSFFLFDEPLAPTEESFGFIGCGNYENNFTAKFGLGNLTASDVKNMNIIILGISIEELFRTEGFVSKYVILMTDEQKDEFTKKYNGADFEDIVYKPEGEVKTELIDLALDEEDFESGEPADLSIYLLDKSGKCIMSA